MRPGHQSPSTTLTVATLDDREQIYRIRHSVYATELAQHTENATESLRDRLDAINVYLVAKREGSVVGFIAITPPSPLGYSVDKYFARGDVSVSFDAGLYEVRLLTVVSAARRSELASLLMYAALRYCESRGARDIVAIGRREVVDVYRRAGMESLGLRVQSGAVTYELMRGRVRALRRNLSRFTRFIERMEREIAWQIDGVPFAVADGCYHGGASFDAIGDEFDRLESAEQVISADVLDAWFEPAPSVVEAVRHRLSFALRASPPSGSEGMRRAIARARDVPVESILPGAGSSDLIFEGLKAWTSRSSRVLVLDPMYGEYAHVLERVVGASVDRLSLRREQSYDIPLDQLREALTRGYDWVVLVNPNSPTGRHVPTKQLRELLAQAPASTRVWIDETYIDYTGDASLERDAARSTNMVVCKSMSKAYALSGARAAYLCAPPPLVTELGRRCPPWAVSLPAQIAACEALRASEYYRQRWQETSVLRQELARALAGLGWDIVPGHANGLLCHLPVAGPDAAAVAAAVRQERLYVREVANMGTGLGPYALRVAVKDRETNRRMIDILQRSMARLMPSCPAPV